MRYIIAILFLVFLYAEVEAQSLTIGEIYDYQVGDEFIVRRDEIGPPTFKYIKIKQRQNYSDSVIYQFKTQFVTRYINKSVWESKDSIYSITFKQLDVKYFGDFPKKDSIAYDTFGRDTNVFYFEKFIEKDTLFFDSCGTLINQNYHFNGSSLSGHYKNTTTAYKGIGVFIDLAYIPGPAYKETLIYYKKGTAVCGTKTGFPLRLKYLQKPSIILTPNPASDYIKINGIENYQYSIYNIAGQAEMRGYTETQNISISTLKKGIYHLVIEYQNEIISMTFVKD